MKEKKKELMKKNYQWYSVRKNANNHKNKVM